MKPFLCVLICGLFYSITFAQQVKVEKALTALNQDTAKVGQLLTLSKHYAYSNPIKMNELADEALRLSQDVNYERGVAMSLGRIGQAKLQLAEHNEALSFLLSALEIADRLDYDECIGISYKLMGNIYLYQHNIEKAEEHYLKALSIAKKMKDTELLASVQNGLGSASLAKNDYKQALKAYVYAQKLAEKNNDKTTLADIESNIGKVYLAQDMGNLAVDFFQKALALAKEAGNIEEIADNSLILSEYYLQRGVLSKALGYAEIGTNAAERVQSKVFKQKGYALMSEIYGLQKSYQKSFEYNQLSKTIQDSILGKEEKQQYTAITSQYENEAKEKEIIIKNLQLEQQKKDLRNQRKITYIFVASSIIFIGLSILAFILYRNKKKTYKLVKEQNKQITEQNEQINAKNEEINEQKTILENKSDALELAYKEIEKKTDNILASISYAKRIQTALLPDQEDVNLAFPENFIYYKPKDVISGDFYYHVEVDELHIIAVADCTGHGVPGAFMSVLGVQSLNKIVQEGITSSDRILNELHREIRQVLKQQVNEVRDGMDIVLCVIDKKNKTLTYSGAINSLYYIQADKNGQPYFTELKATKRPIGGFQRDEEERNFDKHIIDISKTTTFYLSTDGYRDQFGGEESKKFMARRFKELLYHIHDKPMNTQKQILDEVITKWLGKNEQIDDMLVIGIKI
jgi:serine phosphatase RsbU (regulator of sigma subunit)